MNCIKSKGISRDEIRKIVRELRQSTGTENELFFQIVPFFENALPYFVKGFQWEIVAKEEMGDKHGETFPGKHLIRIREDVYLNAVEGKGRDRLTMAHEVGHLLLQNDNDIALCQLQPWSKLKPYEDPEWQANAFGGELLAPSYLIQGMNVYDIHEKCGVSVDAARVQLNTLNYIKRGDVN